MSRHVLLDNVTHKNLKIITKKSAQYGDNIPSVLTFPYEFRNIQTHYPICFKKDEQTQQFYAAAFMGFEQGENLFLTDSGWDASYIPLLMERQPFLIGVQKAADGEDKEVIHIDMDNPRVNESEGEAIFLPFGGSSPYLDRISNILGAISQGQQHSVEFFKTFLEYDLIEPFRLDVELTNGAKHMLEGFYTIHEAYLNALPAEILEQLSRNGMLQQAYMVLASQSNFATLIHRKNQAIIESR